MMRTLIIVLIALNVLYFVGVYLFSVAFNSPPPRSESGIPMINLLNEDKRSGGVAATVSASCFALGPFSVEKTAQLVKEKMDFEGIAVDLRARQTGRLLNYLVFLPQLASRQDAERVVADIKKHNIAYYEIIESGPYQNAIALGSFRDLDKARRHAEYIRYLGYDARYTEQKKPAVAYWLAYDEPTGRPRPVFDWVKAVDPNIKVQKLTEPCRF